MAVIPMYYHYDEYGTPCSRIDSLVLTNRLQCPGLLSSISLFTTSRASKSERSFPSLRLAESPRPFPTRFISYDTIRSNAMNSFTSPHFFASHNATRGSSLSHPKPAISDKKFPAFPVRKPVGKGTVGPPDIRRALMRSEYFFFFMRTFPTRLCACGMSHTIPDDTNIALSISIFTPISIFTLVSLAVLIKHRHSWCKSIALMSSGSAQSHSLSNISH